MHREPFPGVESTGMGLGIMAAPGHPAIQSVWVQRVANGIKAAAGLITGSLRAAVHQMQRQAELPDYQHLVAAIIGLDVNSLAQLRIDVVAPQR